MTFGSPQTRFLATALSLLALPVFAAAPKERAIRPLPEVTVHGVITDVDTGKPIVAAQVFNGTKGSAATGATGEYTIKLPAGRQTQITGTQFGYGSQTKSITPSDGLRVDFALSALPGVTVKLTNGDSHVLDLGTSQFAYLIVFSGYARSDNANFCKPDGSAFTPNKTEFVKITGPAAPATNATCCNLGPVMAADVEMKTGEKAHVFFTDSCFGNEVDFIGRERSTGTFLYFRFTDIAELDFP